MPAKKIAISLSEDVVSAIDTLAEAQGTSRSAWIEQAARAAIRQQGLRDAVA